MTDAQFIEAMTKKVAANKTDCMMVDVTDMQRLISFARFAVAVGVASNGGGGCGCGDESLPPGHGHGGSVSRTPMRMTLAGNGGEASSSCGGGGGGAGPCTGFVEFFNHATGKMERHEISL